MGEYALHKGERIKIGTCEAMYYLRADQVDQVAAIAGNVDPVADRDDLLFRFPFPSEDGIAPGAFEDAFKARRVYGVKVPDGVEHGICQFTNPNGYLLNMPCPESAGFPEIPGGKMFRNGYRGAVELVMQRWWNGRLVGVCKCKGCGALYRMPTLADAAPLLDALEAEAVEQERTADLANGQAEGNRAIAGDIRELWRRLAAGYVDRVAV